MFDHVTIRVSDRAASERFYRSLLGEPTSAGATFVEWDDFGLAQADTAQADAAQADTANADTANPVTRNLHVGFVAHSREEVDALHRRMIDAGFENDGDPGPRPQYGPEYYGGFLRDPDGNSAETVYNGPKRLEDGRIDHLWIGVADLAPQRRFYETIGPPLGIQIVSRLADRFHVADRNRSFALVADGRDPTQHLHLAFPVATDDAVARFHAAATRAGFADNGPPGERAQYHPGYVGAFVLDPDGNNVEAVNHNR